MPPAAKKRKAGPNPQAAVLAPSKKRGIQVFGKITKSQVLDVGKNGLKRKHIEEAATFNDENAPNANELKKQKIAPLKVEVQQKQAKETIETSSRKRKASPSPTPFQLSPPSTPATNSQRKIAPLRSKKGIDTTPTKGARSLFEKFGFGSSSSPARCTSPSPVKYETPPSSPPSIAEGKTEATSPDHDEALPTELQDLVNLHSSFLTALSLYYAHNGFSNPADLRNLYPGIERTWKKRGVTVDDIRRILGVAQEEETNASERTNPSLYLSNYGHNKVCVEMSDSALHAQRRIIDESSLNIQFTYSLRQKWTDFRRRPTIGKPSPTAFISHLQLVPITTDVSLKDLKPLLAKGQRRLEDLKAGAIAAQGRNALSGTTATPSTASGRKAEGTQSRATSLLDRLAAKSLHQSTLPNAPSPETMARKRALQRLPEIAPVLQSLAVGNQKHDNNDTEYADGEAAKARIQVTRQVSFTMATLVQHLQMSLRNPIARDEAVRCVRCLAEVVPEWVGVREVGRLVGVTVRGNGIGRGELEGRIKDALEKL